MNSFVGPPLWGSRAKFNSPSKRLSAAKTPQWDYAAMIRCLFLLPILKVPAEVVTVRATEYSP